MLPIPAPLALDDVEGTARAQVVERLRDAVTPGMTVAVGGGSRGLTDRVGLLRGTIQGLRDPRRGAVRGAGDGESRRSDGGGTAGDV